MKTFAHKISKESIIDVKAKVSKPDQAIKGTSQQVELHVSEIWVVNASAPMLPFQLEDASTRVENQELEEKTHEQHGKEEE
jgi:aspartyl/asparaginyl-tRNA synthetase